MPFIACKLPHGLIIRHNGKTLRLIGANVGEDLSNVSKNGNPNDNARRAAGFGITEVSAPAVDFFEEWKKTVTFKKDGKTKLDEPFMALENGSIMGPFASVAELRTECGDLSSAIVTGTEGLNPEKEGVEEAKDDDKK